MYTPIKKKMDFTYILNNIKCGGCAHTVEQKIKAINKQAVVNVDVESGSVSFDAPDEKIASNIVSDLAKAGYTENDPTAIETAKSYVSCMIGKVNKMK